VGAILTSCGGIDQLLIGIFLGFIAFRSFRGAAGLKRYDRAAPMTLAMNQLVLASGIILYAAYQLWAIANGHSGLMEDIRSQLTVPGFQLDDTISLLASVLKLTYILLIVGTIIFQGLTARYYRSCLKVLDEYLTQTPQWVIDLQKAQAA